jgi:hypothetical protein
MSSIARVNMVLIATRGLLPSEEMKTVFIDCLKETGFTINRNQLISKGAPIGNIHLADRIVIQTTNFESHVLHETERLRRLFTRRAEVALKNYQNNLHEQEARAKQSATNALELAKFIEKLEESKAQSARAYERQLKPNCEALKEELIEEAQNHGYDVIDESKDEIQLQFVKRVY